VKDLLMRIATFAALALIVLNLAACATREQIAANMVRNRDMESHVGRDGRIRLPDAPLGQTCRMEVQSPCTTTYVGPAPVPVEPPVAATGAP
jgi:hypothetical protein